MNTKPARSEGNALRLALTETRHALFTILSATTKRETHGLNLPWYIEQADKALVALPTSDAAEGADKCTFPDCRCIDAPGGVMCAHSPAASPKPAPDATPRFHDGGPYVPPMFPPKPAPDAMRETCNCKANERDGQHMIWCSTFSAPVPLPDDPEPECAPMRFVNEVDSEGFTVSAKLVPSSAGAAEPDAVRRALDSLIEAAMEAEHNSQGLTAQKIRESVASISVAITAPAVGVTREASADDIRAQGWTVAVHNDYRQGAESHTFWLFTKADRAIKGEGRSDAEALNQVRAILALSPAPDATVSEPVAFETTIEGSLCLCPKCGCKPTTGNSRAWCDAGSHELITFPMKFWNAEIRTLSCRAATIQACADLVPTSWLDPLLSGHGSIKGLPGGPTMQLLKALRDRIHGLCKGAK